mmetsp:Transcript_21401/g.30775  ORF Transcript_21401/g.30775 Transcript_21401/m.30775 type:complete len:146 (+) Transcript_21401:365-802(+)
MIPYGNALINTTAKTVECQHGAGECDANVWELCAVKWFPSDQHLPFMECLTHSLPMGYHDEPFDPKIFEDCSEKAGLWFSRLKSCHDKDAWAIQKDAADQTPDDHEYVPWVEINGSHIDEEKVDLVTAICDAYEGEFEGCSAMER